jgi:hypothetical protein
MATGMAPSEPPKQDGFFASGIAKLRSLFKPNFPLCASQGFAIPRFFHRELTTISV